MVKYIAIMGFSYCKNLKKVIIPGTVNQLTRGTFLDCRKLEYVEIPASVIEFFPNCFGGCKSLKRMVFENLKESINNNSDFRFNEEAVVGCNSGVIIEDKATGKEYSLDEVVKGKI